MINTKYLKLGNNASGEEIWACGQQADEAETVDVKGHSVHMLMCPLGKITLGEWPSLEEKTLQLAAFKQPSISEPTLTAPSIQRVTTPTSLFYPLRFQLPICWQHVRCQPIL
jgi:hypothetical protein